MPEPLFSIQSVVLENTAKFCCLVRHEHRNYIFRYAYDTLDQANSVLGNIKRHFGQPAGIETDLAFNYWRYSRGVTSGWRYIRRTTQKNSWYINNQNS